MSNSLSLFLWCIISWNMNGKKKEDLSLHANEEGFHRPVFNAFFELSLFACVKLRKERAK